MHFWAICFALVLTVLLADSVRLSPAEKEGRVHYDGYVVYKLKIPDQKQLSALNFINNRDNKFDVWKEYDDLSKEMHVMVHPEMQQFFTQLAERNGIEVEVMIEDVEKLIERERSVEQIERGKEKFNWKRYHNLKEIYQWLDKILQEHPKVTEEIILGKSYEGRTIRGIKISFKANNPGIVIDANIHAREWITSATVTWLINELLKSTDPTVRELAESVDWYIVPVLNVDGFVYSHEKNRMWRKTRQPNPGSDCVGTDPNRNFDASWGTKGASSDACADGFRGKHPFSEPETKAFADYVKSIKNKLKVYLSFHSYSQLVLVPYGYTGNETPAHFDDLMTIGKAYAEAVEAMPDRTHYRVGTPNQLLPYGIVSGSTIDWALMKMGIKLSYCVELRDTGSYGFSLPPEQIIPNSEETLAGLKAFIKKAKDMGYLTL